MVLLQNNTKDTIDTSNQVTHKSKEYDTISQILVKRPTPIEKVPQS
jgi:hypothetical protein